MAGLKAEEAVGRREALQISCVDGASEVEENTAFVLLSYHRGRVKDTAEESSRSREGKAGQKREKLLA